MTRKEREMLNHPCLMKSRAMARFKEHHVYDEERPTPSWAKEAGL
jgi:hypothetical protein